MDFLSSLSRIILSIPIVYPHFLNPMLDFYNNTPMKSTGAIGPSMNRMILPTFSGPPAAPG